MVRDAQGDQCGLDFFLFLDEFTNLHAGSASWTNERVGAVNFGDQPGPGLTCCPGYSRLWHRLQCFPCFLILMFSPGDITVAAKVSDYMRSARNVLDYFGEKFQGVFENDKISGKVWVNCFGVVGHGAVFAQDNPFLGYRIAQNILG